MVNIKGHQATIPSWALFHDGISAQVPVARFVPNRVLFGRYFTRRESVPKISGNVCPPWTDAPHKECVTVSAAESEDRPPSEMGGKPRPLRFIQALHVQDEAEDKAEDHSPPDFVQGLGISQRYSCSCPFGGCPPKTPTTTLTDQISCWGKGKRCMNRGWG